MRYVPTETGRPYQYLLHLVYDGVYFGILLLILPFLLFKMFTSRKHRKELSLSSPKAATGQAGPLVQELSRASEIMWLFKATGDLQVINGWLGAVLEKYGEEEEE